MKFAPESISPEFRLAQIVEAAARAAECLVGVFYLCGKRHFEIASTFGCAAADAITISGLSILNAVRDQWEDPVVLYESTLDHDLRPDPPWLFGAAEGPARFVAAVHVRYERRTICGLLLVADRLPHAAISPLQQEMLLANAARISALLEQQAHRPPQQQPRPATARRLQDRRVQSGQDAMMITRADPSGAGAHHITSCNAAFTSLTGYSEAELLGRSSDVIRSSASSHDSVARLRHALLHRRTLAVVITLRCKNGTEFPAELLVVPAADQEVALTRWFVAPSAAGRGIIVERFQHAGDAQAQNRVWEQEKAALEAEIQERKRIEARLHHLAFHDNLTSVYNRQFFIDRLAAALDRLTIDPNFQFAVLLLDLDGFKLVNDTFGHHAGDLMLIEIADRLNKSVRADDVVARVGGDEFAILVQGSEMHGYVASMAERVVEGVRHAVQLGSQEVFSSASIGAAFGTKYYRFPEEILRDADIAMYEAKRLHIGFLIFDDTMRRVAVITSRFHNELRRAAALSEFYIEYQPIFDIATNAVKGMEALIRWQHPVRGKLLPGEFISSAEELGLMRQIGTQVLREACRQMQEWRLACLDFELRLSVNISTTELTDVRFISQLEQILVDTGLDPACLQLDVLESVLSPRPEPIMTVLHGIRALGVRIALDDFGIGHSSLGDLEGYPIDAIKIERSFIAGVPERRRTLAIVKAIIDMAKALDLEVIAKGVEQDAQFQALWAAGCTQAQGFLLSQPLAAPAIERLLRDHAARRQESR